MTDIIPRDFIELLLSKIDLVDLIHPHVPLRKKSGSNYFARCPFHNEKSASFSVSQTKQFFYCFGCGAHGNAIDFLMQHDRLSFPDAIETLAHHAGMEVPRTHSNNAAAKKEDSIPALYELLTKTAVYYYEQMCQSTHAIDYLKSRGIAGHIAQQFQIGYAPPGWSHVLDEWGRTETDKKNLLAAGLITQRQEGGFYDRFRDRIIFPIYDYRGRITGFGGRVIAQGEPKYLNSPETPVFQKGHELYGLYQALKANRKLERVVIVEGYMDVIALFQQGITYAVATLGTATTVHHVQRLFRYTTQLIFCFDGDNAGRTAAWRALQIILPLMQDHLQIRFLFLPDGEDPDTFVRKEGKIIFEKKIDEALSLSAFFLQTLSQQCDMNTMEGRAHFASSALNLIKQIPPSIFQKMLADEVSKRARVSVSSQAYQVPRASQQHSQHKQETSAAALASFPKPIRLVAALLLQHPQWVSAISQPLPPSSVEGYAFVSQLIDLIKQKPAITTGALVEYWRGQKEEAMVTQLMTLDLMVTATDIENTLLGAMRQLQVLRLDEEINRLLAKGARDALSDAEKLELSQYISDKKAMLAVRA